MAKNEEAVKNDLFGFGEPNQMSAQYFSGDSFLKGLVPGGDDVDVSVATVNFAPGVRNNWHIHHNGYQIILVTSGEGWAQIEGQPAQSLKPGDVFVFHDGVKHWHGAKKDSWFTHLAITKGTAEWLEPVSDAEYDNLN
ncbi:cupin domain-containing protein [Lactiplantibacillus paraplantarum]|uniref:cupin domain-containing protein n=1 Tax=Lactiplantibacillus paraplantarum TaxID=60520 RepID=UPI00051333A3|nr:cupin domain-containing protein [Lactiplantibacillus paraplantarum]OAX74073.1 cupin [Lactiplantibacillus plantarum]ALO03809.1 cupin [Lactiplantibacillus paraplantarum]KGE76010.1 cupin [Lactiplantibacillus paraplantarum]MCT4457763.1 cupin domain-containing protein [Lactiplantibacillus paraplantarum]RDG11244.1 cupin domain-containing protein [Lactiplantibacillus paraplantarum]